MSVEWRELQTKFCNSELHLLQYNQPTKRLLAVCRVLLSTAYTSTYTTIWTQAMHKFCIRHLHYDTDLF